MSEKFDTTDADAARTKSKHIIIDIGARKKNQIRQLRKGDGALMEEVEQCLHDLRANGRIDGAAQPVILVVRQKSKRSRLCPLCVIAGKKR